MSAEQPVLELQSIREARHPNGGRRVWAVLLKPVEGPDRRPIRLLMERAELRTWDTFHASLVKHLGLHFVVKPALPARLRIPPGVPHTFLPSAWPADPSTPPPSTFAAEAGAMDPARREQLLEMTSLGRAALARR